MKAYWKHLTFINLLLLLVWLLENCEPSSQNPMPVIPPVTQSATIGTSGGSISLDDSAGYTIEFIIPSGALDSSTFVSVTSVGTKIKNPIGNTVFRGLRIEPENLLLNEPATIRITFPLSEKEVGKMCLFSIMEDDYVIPLADLSRGSHTIEGKIYFFKKCAAGLPSEQEILGQIEKAEKRALSGNARIYATETPCGGSCPPAGFGWQGTETTLHGLLEWAATLSALGNDEGAAKAIHAAETIAEKAIEDFLNMGIPENPCGNYTEAAWQYFQLSKLLQVSQATSDAIESRALGMANQCAIRFTIEIDRELKNEGNEKEHQKAYGVVHGSIPWEDFSDAEASLSGHGTLSYTYSYEWEYNQAMHYKSTANASGTIDVTCDGYTDVKYPAEGQPEIWLHVSIHFKDNISGTSCDTGDHENPCEDTESHAEWNESVDFLFQNGYTIGGQVETKDGYIRDKKTLYVTRLDLSEDDSDTCY